MRWSGLGRNRQGMAGHVAGLRSATAWYGFACREEMKHGECRKQLSSQYAHRPETTLRRRQSTLPTRSQPFGTSDPERVISTPMSATERRLSPHFVTARHARPFLPRPRQSSPTRPAPLSGRVEIRAHWRYRTAGRDSFPARESCGHATRAALRRERPRWSIVES
jgi:hypothetical protein